MVAPAPVRRLQLAKPPKRTDAARLAAQLAPTMAATRAAAAAATLRPLLAGGGTACKPAPVHGGEQILSPADSQRLSGSHFCN